MEGIKSTVLAICAISAARCIVGNAAAASKFKSGLTTMFNLLLAMIMITPFAQGTISLELPDISDYSYPVADYGDDAYAIALKSETEANITTVLEQQLDSAGINFELIETNVNISADYSISISSVTITAEDYEAAALMVKNCLGMETEVINGNS